MLSIYLRHLNPTKRFNKSEPNIGSLSVTAPTKKLFFLLLASTPAQVTYLFALKTWGTRHKSAIVTCTNFKQRLQYKIQPR